MGCDVIEVPGGAAIVCTRGRSRSSRACVGCGARATRLCDYRVAPGRGEQGLCSAPLCARCTRKHGGLDHCPAHDLARAAAQESAP